MSENVPVALDAEPSSCDAYLVLDDTAAVVSAPPSIARSLYDHFHDNGVSCSLSPGPGGRDVIDFGNPSAGQERLIRAVFASWHKREPPGSSVWCVWLVCLVVAVWIVSLLAAG
jgi:hypothetical protein